MSRPNAVNDARSRDEELQETFRRSLDDGTRRLQRSWPNLTRGLAVVVALVAVLVTLLIDLGGL